MASLQLFSPAKINITLDVLKKREDSFHEVEMILQTIALYDSIQLAITKERGIFFKSSHPNLRDRETNLAFRAAKILFEKYQLPGGLSIHLTKEIPIAAGLGGGSSNGAAVLLGIRQLYSLPLEEEELLFLAASLGSDVPFFLKGGAILCRGRGEKLSPLSPLPSLPLLLLVPPIGLSTPLVYGELREEEKGRRLWTERAFKAMEKGDLSFLDSLGNDLEGPARRLSPSLNALKETLEKEGLNPYLSGSGPSLFLFLKEEGSALKRRLSSLLGPEVLLMEASTTAQGIIDNQGREVWR